MGIEVLAGLHEVHIDAWLAALKPLIDELGSKG